MQNKRCSKPFGLAWIVITVCLCACDPWFSYSPYEAQLEETYRGTTATKLAEIELQNSHDSKPFKIALFGDAQYHYGGLEDAIAHINERGDFAFVIVAGDLTENGLKQEFIFFYRLMSQLKIPYVTVIGNHDYLANGEEIYKQMYGSFNYSFVFNNVKFILFDNNTIESGKQPDMQWLAAEFRGNDKYDYVIPVSHIPPYDAQMKDYHQQYHELLLVHGVTLSVHGHRHDFSVEDVYGDGIRFLTASSPQKRTYSELSISAQGLEVRKIEY